MADGDSSSKSPFSTAQQDDQSSSDACEQLQLALADAFIGPGADSAQQVGRQLGLLFHAAEYPAFQEDAFPINLGYCQEGSTLEWDVTRMDLRNILWYQVSHRGVYTALVGAASGYHSNASLQKQLSVGVRALGCAQAFRYRVSLLHTTSGTTCISQWNALHNMVCSSSIDLLLPDALSS
jgi:hypothetical protein